MPENRSGTNSFAVHLDTQNKTIEPYYIVGFPAIRHLYQVKAPSTLTKCTLFSNFQKTTILFHVNEYS